MKKDHREKTLPHTHTQKLIHPHTLPLRTCWSSSRWHCRFLGGLARCWERWSLGKCWGLGESGSTSPLHLGRLGRARDPGTARWKQCRSTCIVQICRSWSSRGWGRWVPSFGDGWLGRRHCSCRHCRCNCWDVIRHGTSPQ